MKERLPHEKGFHVSWDQIHRDARALAWRLDGHGPDEGSWRAVVAITRGGLIPAAIIARELEIRVIETVSVVTYDEEQRGAPVVAKPPAAAGDGEGWLLIDDLVDTGNTARVIRKLLPKAYFATLYAKPMGREIVDLCVKEFRQDKWVYFPWDIDYKFVPPLKKNR